MGPHKSDIQQTIRTFNQAWKYVCNKIKQNQSYQLGIILMLRVYGYVMKQWYALYVFYSETGCIYV